MTETIMVVDDEKSVVDMVEMSLAKPHRRFVSAADGKSALSLSRVLSPNLILLDLGLPGQSGVSVCRALRKDASTRSIPIMVLTGRTRASDEIRLLNMGADDYVTKPFEPSELRARVNALLRQARSHARSETQGKPDAGAGMDAARYANFFSLSSDLLCIAGFDGYFKDLNPSWERTLGFTIGELLQKPYLDFVHPEDRQRTIEEAERVSRGASTFAFENRYACKDGSYKWLLWQATPVPHEGLIYAVARDVSLFKASDEELRRSKNELALRVKERTAELQQANNELRVEMRERAKLQAQLVQAQKMEAVGRIAGGVAHDFNNLLMAIGGFSRFLWDGLAGDDKRRADVEQIMKAVERAASLTRQLLAFSRQQVLQPRILDCNDVVADMKNMLRRLISEDIEFTTSLSPALGKIKADRGQLEQVVLNLAVNARDAMPNGGKITLETSNVQLGEDYTRMHLQVKPGSYVMLAVSDTGCGMNSETLSHIFEPFFTTKEQGKGTGLGLATVYGIVKQSEGGIYVYSEPGQGTTFKIYLPLAQDEAEPVEPGPAPAKSVNGSETLLLVEDDELVRTFLQRALAEAGYTVLAAQGPQDALRLCGLHEDAIHLALTDVVMPQMHGPELINRLRVLRPGLKAIYMSGYTDTTVAHHDLVDSGAPFLQKPVAPDVLARKIREILDENIDSRR